MASITSKPNIFFFTSPRTPSKMKEEIKLLVNNFSGHIWNKQTQSIFYQALVDMPFNKGTITNNSDFQARDRINRAPKALGFVDLDPHIQETAPGKLYIYGNRPHEIFTRQLLKFQFPSPYHVDSKNTFFVRPYLEIIRLIKDLDYLSKDEIAIFVIQLKNIDMYEVVKSKIINFRSEIKDIDRKNTNYNRVVNKFFEQEIRHIYRDDIEKNNINTRQTSTKDVNSFINKKRRNHIDYADASIRYLRETKMFTMNSSRSNRIRIIPERIPDVDFIISNTIREPIIFKGENEFKEYLFDVSIPLIISDNKNELINSIVSIDNTYSVNDLERIELEDLKDLKDNIIDKKLAKEIEMQKESLRSYKLYEDIISVFNDIESGHIVDSPTVMEWNTWRAFTMINDGDIIGNFTFDDSGLPLNTAPGGKPDILCIYSDFDVIVEVTLSKGVKQYEMEGEPVARHLGSHKKNTGRESYCIFIANKINLNTLAHFYGLHKIEIMAYGGKSKIIPLTLSNLKMILEESYKNHKKPSSNTVKDFIKYLCESVDKSNNEQEWSNYIDKAVLDWKNFIR